MVIFEAQERQARDCYRFLSGEDDNKTNLLKETRKWGFPVYELKHDITTTRSDELENFQFTQTTIYYELKPLTTPGEKRNPPRPRTYVG
jgi:hypothetical protein